MKPKTKTTASLAVVGVDIGKEVFHLVGLGTDGQSPFAGSVKDDQTPIEEPRTA